MSTEPNVSMTRKRFDALMARLDKLKRENVALRKDKEILDWMNENIEAIIFKRKPDGFVWDVRHIVRVAMPREVKS